MRQQKIQEKNDYFTLFDFSAKWDPVPTMLCQNHTQVIKGFYGQTTAYNKDVLKTDVLVMGENKMLNEARYIHGEFGKGTWTFYGGHDPEDYRHLVGDPPTDLSLTPNSPGYRLILNNVLFPAAKKEEKENLNLTGLGKSIKQLRQVISTCLILFAVISLFRLMHLSFGQGVPKSFYLCLTRCLAMGFDVQV